MTDRLGPPLRLSKVLKGVMKSERDAIHPLTAISTEPLDIPTSGTNFKQVENSAHLSPPVHQSRI
jgi:hypothetical protein